MADVAIIDTDPELRDLATKKLRLGVLKGALFGARGLHWLANRLNGAVKRTVTVDEARDITRWSYDRASSYKRAPTQRLGLHAFEKDAIDAFFPPPPAKLLVLGCGGGRELFALFNVGYTCVASEPASQLAAAAAALVGSGAAVHVGGIEDCAQHNADGPFDGVVVGWGAWGYLLRVEDRLAALQKLRRLCPTGPVLLSWQMLVNVPISDAGQQVGVPKGWTGAAAGDWRKGLRISSGRGIAAAISAKQIVNEAENTGYAVILDGTTQGRYPHAVLRPTK